MQTKLAGVATTPDIRTGITGWIARDQFTASSLSCTHLSKEYRR